MRRRELEILLGVLLAGGMPSLAVAQAPQHPESDVGFWGTLALGPSAPHGFGGAIGASVRFRRIAVRIRAATSAELFGDGVSDWGLLAGGAIDLQPGRSAVTIMAGIGRSTSTRGCLLCGSSSESAMAMLLELEARLRVVSFFGISANAFADFNSLESFGGLGVGIYLGRL